MFSGDRGQCLLSSLPWSSWSSVITTCHSDLAAVIIPCNSEHVAWQDLTLQTMMMGWSWIASIFTDFGNSSTVCRGCSVTSRCPPDYSVTDKTAPHKFLFWPRVQVNHPPGQGARDLLALPGHLVFISNISGNGSVSCARLTPPWWMSCITPDGVPRFSILFRGSWNPLQIMLAPFDFWWISPQHSGNWPKPSELFTQATIFRDFVFRLIHSRLLNISKMY